MIERLAIGRANIKQLAIMWILRDKPRPSINPWKLPQDAPIHLIDRRKMLSVPTRVLRNGSLLVGAIAFCLLAFLNLISSAAAIPRKLQNGIEAIGPSKV